MGRGHSKHNTQRTRGASLESLAALKAGDNERLLTLTVEYIRSCGSDGAIADEVCAALGMIHNSVAPRIVELEASGIVVRLTDANGERVRRKTRQGCCAGVVVAAEFASQPQTRQSKPEGHQQAHQRDLDFIGVTNSMYPD